MKAPLYVQRLLKVATISVLVVLFVSLPSSTLARGTTGVSATVRDLTQVETANVQTVISELIRARDALQDNGYIAQAANLKSVSTNIGIWLSGYKIKVDDGLPLDVLGKTNFWTGIIRLNPEVVDPSQCAGKPIRDECPTSAYERFQLLIRLGETLIHEKAHAHQGRLAGLQYAWEWLLQKVFTDKRNTLETEAYAVEYRRGFDWRTSTAVGYAFPGLTSDETADVIWSYLTGTKGRYDDYAKKKFAIAKAKKAFNKKLHSNVNFYITWPYSEMFPTMCQVFALQTDGSGELMNYDLGSFPSPEQVVVLSEETMVSVLLASDSQGAVDQGEANGLISFSPGSIPWGVECPAISNTPVLEPLPVVAVPPMPVGGIAGLPPVAGSPGRPYAALAGGLATAAFALTAGAWYARRRRLR